MSIYTEPMRVMPEVSVMDAALIYETASGVTATGKLATLSYEDLSSRLSTVIAGESIEKTLQHDDPTCRDVRSESTMNTLTGLLVPGTLDRVTRRSLTRMYIANCALMKERYGIATCEPWQDGRNYVAAAAVGHMYVPRGGHTNDFDSGEFHMDAQPSSTWHLGTPGQNPKKGYQGRYLMVSHYPSDRHQFDVQKRDHTLVEVLPDTIIVVNDSRQLVHGVTPIEGATAASVNFSASTGSNSSGIEKRWQK